MKVAQIIFYLFIFLLFPAVASAEFTVLSTSVISNDTETWSPGWSPDGNSIAFIAYDDSRNQQVFTMGVDGSGKERITSTPNRKWGVAWLKEGITYISYDADGLEKIFIVQPDGTGLRKVLDDKMRQGREESVNSRVFGEVSRNPVTGKLLFTSLDKINNEKIYEVNLDGTGKKLVIDDNKRQWDPEWNQDGTSFVYISYDDNNNIQLFTANADGTANKQLTFDNIKKYDPNWGHEGILFVSFEDRLSSGEKLYIINPDGTGKKLAIGDGFKQKNPRWSADGTEVLYEETDIKGNKQIKTLYLQKPEVALTPSAITPAATAAVSAAPTGALQTPPEDAGVEPSVEETEESDLKAVLLSMFLVLALVVIVMLAVLLLSDLLSKK